MMRRLFLGVWQVSLCWSLLFAACGSSGGGGKGSGGSPGGPGGWSGGGSGGGGGLAGPAVTPVGTPTGRVRTARIGAAGGTLQTADGSVELIVPPGALAAETELSLTPISPQAPLHVGPAVRLGPDGTSFATPAKLVLHYQAFAAGTEPDLLLAATQDGDGRWLPAGAPELDTAAKTVTVAVPHFSDWNFAACAKLEVSNYVVGAATPSDLSVEEQCEDPQSQTAPLFPARPTAAPVEWKKEDATGMPGPGTLTPHGSSATLTADTAAPPDPRVFVSAEWHRPSGSRRLQDTVVVGTMLDFTVDGHTIIVSEGFTDGVPMVPLAYTAGATTLLGGGTTKGTVNVRFVGAGVGGFSSDPMNGVTVGASIAALGPNGSTSINYFDTWNDPCTSDVKAVLSRVSVSHASRERQFIRGSFEGQLSVTRGKTTCSGTETDDQILVPLSGTFITRWLMFQ